MLKKQIKAKLARDPFVPVRLYLDDGRKFDVPFREVAHVLSIGLLVFIGMKQGSIRADTYDRFPFEKIVRVEDRPMRKTIKRRKAS